MRLRVTAAFASLLCFALAQPARALDCTWNSSSGPWTDAARWSCGVVPDGDDTAVINGGHAIVSAAQAVASLTLTAGQLTTEANLTVASTLTWGGGFLVGQNGAALVLAGGGTGTVGAGVLHTGGRLQNEGTVTLPAAATFTGSGTFDNRGWLVLAGTQFNVVTENTGTMRKTGAGTTTVGARVTSTGPIVVEAGILTLNLSVNTLGGAATVAAGATLRINNSSIHSSGSSVAGAGSLELGGGVHTIDGPVTWSVASVTFSSGELRPTNGSATVTGSFTWTGGFLTGQNGHALVLGPAVTGTFGGGVLHTGGRLQNEGTMTLPAAATFTGSGTFDNRGTLVLAGTQFNVVTQNAGTIRKTGVGSTSLGAALTQSNTGALVVEAGTLAGPTSGSIAGAVTTTSGATLQYRGGTLAAGLTHAGTGTVEFAGTVTVLAGWAHPGLTRIATGQANFDNAASVTFAALTHVGGFLDIQRPAATITGTFTRTGGTLRTAGNTLTFAGNGVQLLDLSVATTFTNVVVSASTTLVEVQPASNAAVSGTLTNLGVIRKTRTMAQGTNPFGLTGVTLDVAALGTLSSVQIDRRDTTHPSAGPDQQTGRYWSIAPVGAGYTLAVTLPHAVAAHATTAACRLVGSAWDCGRSASAVGQVTRSGVTTLSDWTVGTNFTATETYTISGTARLGGTTPMAGVSVQLSGASSATTVTDGAGAYAFAGLAGGTYTVVPSLSGYAFTPATRAFTSLSSNQVADFSGQKVWAVTGTVRDLNDTGVPGVTVTVTGSASRSTTTDADGRYAFPDLPEGGTYVVTPTQLSFAFTPTSQTFTNLVSNQVAAFFIAEVGTFTRYFAEGATSDFFDTEIALLNATGQPTTANLQFLKGDGTVVTHVVPLDGLARATVLPKSLPGLASAEFSTVITSTQPLIADRTMRWDSRGYGSHAETSIATPALQWYLAEGATLGGFNLFYLIQNPNPTAADVEVTYLLPAPQAPIVRTYTVAPNTRFNIWVNLEAPELAAAEVSAVIRATNAVPVIVERAMYRNTPSQAFDAGHESAGITAPATEWFLAEGATGDYFDLFVLIANPETSSADVAVDYLLPDGSVLSKTYAVAPQSRFNIWVDFEDARLASTAVSAKVRSTNAVPIIVERAMWWPGDSSTWHEGHNSAGADRTSTKWGLADGQVGGPFEVETYVLIANTSSTGGSAQVTLVFEDGTTAVRTIPLLPNSRESIPVSLVFPEATGRRFGTVVESLGDPAPEIVVERAMYGNAGGVRWAAGSNVIGTRLR